MCQITVLRVDLLGCIQPLIWLNLNGIKCLLVGPWLAYYISHFNEKHSHANTVCLEWGQMQLSWLMKAFDHSSTNWNLEKEEAIWTGICKPMNYLVHIIHKSLWRGGLVRFQEGEIIVGLPTSVSALSAAWTGTLALNVKSSQPGKCVTSLCQKVDPVAPRNLNQISQLLLISSFRMH